MKSRLLLLILSIASLFAFGNQENAHYDQLFEQANQAYKLGEYDSAKTIYSEIVNNGFKSSELFYNLGNAHFKNGNLPAAILYYERALRINQIDKDAIYNLEVANSFIADKIEPKPKLFIAEWWAKLSNTLSMNGWAIMFLLSLCLTCVSFGLFLMGTNMALKQLSFILTFILLLVTIISFTLGKESKELNEQHSAIVFSPSVNVKSEPDIKSTVQFVIHEGLKVEIVTEDENWVRINISDGNSGWIPLQSIERI